MLGSLAGGFGLFRVLLGQGRKKAEQLVDELEQRIKEAISDETGESLDRDKLMDSVESKSDAPSAAPEVEVQNESS
jgi:hypothetical protein